MKNLKTEEEYKKALKEIEELWDLAEPGTSEGDRFEYLSNLIDIYEKEHYPITSPTEEEVLEFRKDQEKNEDL